MFSGSAAGQRTLALREDLPVGPAENRIEILAGTHGVGAVGAHDAQIPVMQEDGVVHRIENGAPLALGPLNLAAVIFEFFHQRMRVPVLTILLLEHRLLALNRGPEPGRFGVVAPVFCHCADPSWPKKPDCQFSYNKSNI